MRRKNDRPRVITRCVADSYHSDGERIVEVAWGSGSDHGSFLIAIRVAPTTGVDVSCYSAHPHAFKVDGSPGAADGVSFRLRRATATVRS